LSRPFPPRGRGFVQGPRVNGKIRSREVRVIDPDGKQLGIMALSDALNAARNLGVDLVEIAAGANPPVCRIIDFGKFRYEQNKKEKETKKTQHANQIKEIQLTPRIDPHDVSIKVQHAINFFCEDMKVKICLRFKGREMAHKEFGFKVIDSFIEKTAQWGHPDSEARLSGRTINLIMSPLPKNKRAPNPAGEGASNDDTEALHTPDIEESEDEEESHDEGGPPPESSVPDETARDAESDAQN
jgi:translation initiation factor IF-3